MTQRASNAPQENYLKTSAEAAEASELQFKDVAKMLRRRKKLALFVFGVVFGLSAVNAVYARITKPVYSGSFRLLIKDPISASENSSSNPITGNANFSSLALNENSSDIPTLISVMRSPIVLEGLAKKFNTSAGALASNISIVPDGSSKTGILRVTLTSKNPDQGQILIEELAQTYLKAAQAQRQQTLRSGLEFLTSQSPELEAKTAVLLNELEEFRQQNSVLEATTEASQIEGALASQEQALEGLLGTRQVLLKIKDQIKAGKLTSSDFEGSITSSGFDGATGTGSLNGALKIGGMDPGLIGQLNQVEESLADARSRYNPGSQTVQRLEIQKEKLKPLLLKSQLSAVDTALSINSEQVESSTRQINKLKSQFRKQPALIKQFEKLTGQLDVAKANLTSLQNTKDSFSLQMAQNNVPWRLMGPAFMGRTPIGPSVSKELTKGFIAAIALGFLAAYARDRFDHTYHSSTEIQEALRLPLLGHIPHVEMFQGVREDKRFLLDDLDDNTKDIKNFEANSYQRFFYQEAFRNLYTSIRFLNAKEPIQALALTSSVPSEGKSLINILLAKTLADMGKKILLIDADLRKPQLHTRLGLNNLTGLSNLLAEPETNWEHVIQDVPGYSSWKVVTAGLRPPDPARLLSSESMENAIQKLRENKDFDLILFDTPPVLGLADASLVAQNCDGLMLLVSLDRVDRNLPQQAAYRISESGAPLVGIITNSIKEGSKGLKYGYGYGKYGYRYGKYGYQYGEYGAYDTANVYGYYSGQDEQQVSMSKENIQEKPPKEKFISAITTIKSKYVLPLLKWLDS